MNIEVNLSPEAAWTATLSELELQMTRATFNQWLKGARFVREYEGVFTIGVESPYGRDWLNLRLKDTIERTLGAIAGRPCTVEIGMLDEFEVARAIPQNGRSGGQVNGNGRTAKPEPPEEPQKERPWTVHEDGYGGNLTPEQRAELVSRIEARKSRGRVSSALSSARAAVKSKPSPSESNANAASFNNLRNDEAYIGVVSGDPARANLETAHYAHKFWRPLIGLAPFSLWEIMRSYNYFVLQHGAEWPSISLISETLGLGDRYTILGREATATRPAQQGAIDVLVEHGLCIYDVIKNGSKNKYVFLTQEHLPILTPYQVSKLSSVKQKEHKKLLKRYKNFKYDAWEAHKGLTFVEPLTWDML